MSDINLFDDDPVPESVPESAPEELTEVLNISRYSIRMNGVLVDPGAVGEATPADLKRIRRSMIREVQSDATEAPLDE